VQAAAVVVPLLLPLEVVVGVGEGEAEAEEVVVVVANNIGMKCLNPMMSEHAVEIPVAGHMVGSSEIWR
jgi:hypothetical protein